MDSPADSGVTLAEIAERYGLTCHGDATVRVAGACALSPGQPNRLAFADAQSAPAALRATRAAAVLVSPDMLEACPVAALVSDNPRLSYARVAGLFEPPPPPAGVHPSAWVADTASVDATACVGANAVIGEYSEIGANTVVGPGCAIGDQVTIGADGRIGAQVTIESRSRIGARVRIEAGAVIGARGFGLVHNGRGWEAIPQLGCVRVGDDVEIGAATTIDRGAIDDTVIGDGVKIDDQVHIAHNCVIGAHTVIAGCTGIAGSCTIGANCMIGGGVGIGDHVSLADGVILTAASQVPKNIESGGVYSSTFRAMPAKSWRKRLALFRQLDRIERRLRGLERGAPSDGESMNE